MIIKNPGGKHHGFRLFERKDGGYKTVRHPDLALINKDYRSGLLAFDKARLSVERLREALEKAQVKLISWLPENVQVAEQYYSEMIKPKGNRAPQAAWDRIMWAMKKLGPVPLISSSKAQISDRVGELSPNAQRRFYSTINPILRFKGSTLKFFLPKVEKSVVDFLSLKEFEAVLKELPPKLHLLVKVAFGTGARLGEVFALTEIDFRKARTHFYISRQLYESGERGSTKNDKEGTVFIIPEMREAAQEWVKVAAEERKRIRWHAGTTFTSTCEKVLGRHLTFHNLRHSYANYMLSKGASLEELRAWLRDSMNTVERYYISWVQDDDTMTSNLRRFG